MLNSTSNRIREVLALAVIGGLGWAGMAWLTHGSRALTGQTYVWLRKTDQVTLYHCNAQFPYGKLIGVASPHSNSVAFWALKSSTNPHNSLKRGTGAGFDLLLSPGMGQNGQRMYLRYNSRTGEVGTDDQWLQTPETFRRWVLELRHKNHIDSR